MFITSSQFLSSKFQVLKMESSFPYIHILRITSSIGERQRGQRRPRHGERTQIHYSSCRKQVSREDHEMILQQAFVIFLLGKWRSCLLENVADRAGSGWGSPLADGAIGSEPCSTDLRTIRSPRKCIFAEKNISRQIIHWRSDTIDFRTRAENELRKDCEKWTIQIFPLFFSVTAEHRVTIMDSLHKFRRHFARPKTTLARAA